MDKIRVNGDIVIEVNDNGDTITIKAEDQLFINKFYSVCDRVDEITAQSKTSEVKSMSQREQLQFMIARTQELMADIDNVFGKDTCLKVFGDIVPSWFLLIDFLEQLTPIVEKHAGKRKQIIDEKYNNNRKGSRNKRRNKRKSQYRTKEEIIQDAMR